MTDPSDPTKASTNHGAMTSMGTGAVSATTQRSLVKFDLASLPTTAIVVSSTLSLRKAQGNGTVTVVRAAAPWSESTVTWNGFGDAYSVVGFQHIEAGAVPVSGYLTSDITEDTQSWISGTTANQGVLLFMEYLGRARFGTSEAPNQASRPSLSVCYMPGE